MLLPPVSRVFSSMLLPYILDGPIPKGRQELARIKFFRQIRFCQSCYTMKIKYSTWIFPPRFWRIPLEIADLAMRQGNSGYIHSRSHQQAYVEETTPIIEEEQALRSPNQSPYKSHQMFIKVNSYALRLDVSFSTKIFQGR